MKLFVGNLSWDATEEDIFEAFGKFGTISECKVITDRESGKSRGFAFITLEGGGDAAIKEMDGSEFLGRELRVSIAKERPR